MSHEDNVTGFVKRCIACFLGNNSVILCRACIAFALTLFSAVSIAHADGDPAQSAAKFASGDGTVIYVAAGIAAPLLQDGANGSQHALRTADALLTSSVITEGLKHIVREPRPLNPNDRTSFPSGHATAVFSIAAMESHFHPSQAPLWYLGATLIAISRVKLHAHRVRDVVAGAAVGIATAHFEQDSAHGLLLFPFIKNRDSQGPRTQGLALGGSF